LRPSTTPCTASDKRDLVGKQAPEVKDEVEQDEESPGADGEDSKEDLAINQESAGLLYRQKQKKDVCLSK
jgi:hypothetical protein